MDTTKLTSLNNILDKVYKKHNLTKVLSILILLVIIISYFIEGRDGISRIALGDALMNYLQSFYYFFDTFFVLKSFC